MNTTTIQAIQYKKDKIINGEETVVNDKTLHLKINNTITRNFSVLGDSIKEFITGYMFTEGIISSVEDILSLDILDEETLDIIAEVKTKEKNSLKESDDNIKELTLCSDASGGLRKKIESKEDIIPIESELIISKNQILEEAEKLRENAKIWQATGGCHVAAIIYKDQFIVKEDVSRHVAVDKVIGAGAYAKFDFSKSHIVYSGRMPADMVIKLVRTKIPILISNAAPSNSGIKIAEKGNITLIGFVRGNRFNAYTHTNRIKF